MKLLFSKRFFGCLLLLVFSHQIYAQSIDELKSQIAAINKVLTKAVLENDSEKMFSYYTNDAISLPSYEPMIKGIEALKAHGEKNKNAPYKMNEFTLSTTDVFTDGNLVVEVGKYALIMEMMDAPEPIKDNGKYITIFQKQNDGSLKIKLDMWNSNMNPWMAEPKMAGKKKHKMHKGNLCSKCKNKKCKDKCEGNKGTYCSKCKKKDCKKCSKEKKVMMKEKAKQLKEKVELKD